MVICQTQEYYDILIKLKKISQTKKQIECTTFLIVFFGLNFSHLNK